MSWWRMQRLAPTGARGCERRPGWGPRARACVWPVLVLSISLQGGCRDRPAAPEPEAKLPAPVREQASQSKATAEPSQPPAKHAQPLIDRGELRLPASKRVVAVGDLHGDMAATRAALSLAGALGDGDRWVGGDLTLVQTGDQLDRGDDERAIVDLFVELQRQASAVGGRVIALNGNHETMNVQGDFRYVTEAGLGFGDVDPASPLSQRAPERFRQRAAAFLPGGEYANILAKRRIAVVVGDSAFVHGGLLPSHLEYGLERINREVSAWMRGELARVPDSVASEDAPVWTRAYGADESVEACRLADEVLKRLGVARLVVGHTPQERGVTSICGDKVWRIDVGLAAYYGDGPVAVLEIEGGRARVLSKPRSSATRH